MPCNDINNPSFEGGFDFWYPGANPYYTTAWVGSGDAYAGDQFVTIATTPEYPIGTVNQDLYWLDDEVPYELTVHFRLVEPFGLINGCTVSALLGEHEIASLVVEEAGDWAPLTGEITPPERNMTISLKAVCGFGEGGSELQGQVLFDEVLFGPRCD
ncbi:uncharacterized protein DSM5745_08550 [Aspergillus mulundensis]|uniref:CBM-cenC domain-containing protein n=1 Tax=Aspergillus mulundensis TaxID=1810919 RepID=A0A3D8R496_9EURO|nr:hypothetical protein DSM5745_08550 [Aspergillus mulundensis]RDW68790.1 hypothetical protein DSM5745_08550 [Aspergillus mulundensis]